MEFLRRESILPNWRSQKTLPERYSIGKGHRKKGKIGYVEEKGRETKEETSTRILDGTWGT